MVDITEKVCVTLTGLEIKHIAMSYLQEKGKIPELSFPILTIVNPDGSKYALGRDDQFLFELEGEKEKSNAK